MPGTFTPNIGLYKPLHNEVGWDALVNTNFDILDTQIGNIEASLVTSVFGRVGAVVALTGDYSFSQISGKAGLAQGGTNADLSGTGGASQVLKQTSVGGTVTVGQLATSDISGISAIASSGAWSALQNAIANLTLANAGFSTEFDQTSAVNWTWANTTAATNSTVAPALVSSLTVTGTSASASINTNGATLLVAVLVASASPPTIADSQNNTWTYLTTRVGTRIGYAFGITTSAAHTFTLAGSAPFAVIYAFSGTLTTALVFDTQNGSTGGGATFQPGSITPTAGDVVVTGYGNNSHTTAASIDSGFAAPIVQSNSSFETGAASYLLNAANSALNPTWTDTGGASNACVIACFKQGSTAVNPSSPIFNLKGTYWNGSASAADTWTMQNVLGANVTNPISTLTFTHTGTSGVAAVSIPAFTSVLSLGAISVQNTAPASSGSALGSPPLQCLANYWTGSVSALDTWAIASLLTAGGSASTLVFSHSGAAGASVQVPQLTTAAGSAGKCISLSNAIGTEWSNIVINQSSNTTLWTSITSTQPSIGIGSYGGTNPFVNQIIIGHVNALTHTSGTVRSVNIGAPGGSGVPILTFSPTSGNAAYVALQVNPTINVTGTASGGKYTAILANVVETSLTGMAGNLLLDLQSGTTGGTSAFSITNLGVISTYNKESTAGVGSGYLRGSTAQKAETGADAALLSVTPAAVAGLYRIAIVLSVSAASAATLGWTATWTDSNAHAQAPANLSLQTAGSATIALTVTAAANATYFGEWYVDVNNAGTAIVVKTTFSGTSIAYKASATIERVQ